MTVHIACSTFNGSRYFREFAASLANQTHRDWILWIRDNGSTDGSVELADSLAASDPRFRIADRSGTPLGVVGTFARLLDLVPADADPVMLADQDDIWQPGKIEMTLAAMRDAERTAPGPTLVHTDLSVVDDALREMDGSFWHFNGVDPRQVELRRIAVKNNVTAGTVMINRALRDLVAHIPDEAAVHDWWIAMVAAAFGRIVALPAQTVLYRQHDSNVIGALRPLSAMNVAEVAAASAQLRRRTDRMRANIVAAARQAGAFARRYADRLAREDREFLEAYARMPTRGFLARKLDLVRMQLLPGNSVLQNIGILIRA